MQSAFQQQSKLRLSMIAVACQLACLSMSAYAQTDAPAPAAEEKKTVIITGKKIGMGLMVTEDAPKARSTITAEELEKQRPTGNAYEALEMLPAVNSYNHDATGLFGGGLTLRGFNSDQIGATINGVPVNDSGNFAVFPQEYVDQENTCSEYVTQGSTDVDSPQVGATGGNFNITTCNPESVRRVRVMQTLGQLNMYKTFVRYDTGLLSDNRSKAFVSISQAQADKWKGPGKAKRDHLDAGFNYDWDRFNFIHATFLWNDANNNNFASNSLATLNTQGYYADFSNTFSGKLPGVKGTAQVEKVQSPNYYLLQNNPFKNGIASATAKFRLTENLDVKIVPYYWYGFGTGGGQQKVQSESKFYDAATGTDTAKVDLNGDGDTLDTVIIANSSVTHTDRPGVTSSLTWTVGDHVIYGGMWYERAKHVQTGPGELVDANGHYQDFFLQANQITRPDGKPFESRDWRTVSTAYQAFLQDTMTLLNDKATLNLGVRLPHVERDFTNTANEGAGLNTTYHIDRTYKAALPQFGARYRITNDDQLFASVAKNMKAPPNFVFGNLGSNVKIINGVPTLTADVKAETSVNVDIGYRHQDNNWIGSLTFYSVNFKDRQATAFDVNAQASSLTNVGNVKNHGFEIEAGNTPWHGLAFYGSYGYSKSKIENDLSPAAGLYVPTAGKEMPLTPKQKLSLSAEYQIDAFWIRAKAKATSKQWATLANDELVPGYTVFGLDGGYTFANYGVLKRPKLTFNVSNLTSKQYRNPNSQNVVNAQKYVYPAGTINANTVNYYVGAPRFTSITFSADY